MWLSTPGPEKENLEALALTVDDLRAKLNGGDLAAYAEMTKILVDREARSNQAIREFRESIATSETQMTGLRLDVERVRDGQGGLNIIGLVLVLLKDLPIWGSRRHAQ